MSGAFNIATDASQNLALNGAVGFSRDDVSRAIVECTGYDAGSDEHAAIVATLTKWGNGYLFAPELTAESGMYQSVMVVQLLNAVKELPRDRVLGFLASWEPSVPLQAEPDRALMDYYAPSAALLPLLEQLTGPGKSIPAPGTLNALSLADQVAAAAASTPTVSARDAIVRALFYEGLLTHTPMVAGAGYAPPQLRVPNNNMQRRFFDRFVEHLRKNDGMVRAVEKFIVRGECGPLERVLAKASAPALIAKAVQSWYELHVSQRLAMALTTAEVTTGFRWAQEVPFARVSATQAEGGRTDVYGVSSDKMRHIIIEAKQIHMTFDIEGFPTARGVLNDARTVARMSESTLLALKLKLSSIKVKEGGASPPGTAGDVVAAAKVQVSEYAEGWRRAYAGQPGAVLDTYVAVACGPLRYVIQHAQRYTVLAAAPTGAAAQLK